MREQLRGVTDNTKNKDDNYNNDIVNDLEEKE